MDSNDIAQSSAPDSSSEEGIDLRQTIDLLLTGKWVIFFFTFVVTFLGGAYAYLAEPIFEADGLVQVEQNEKGLATATHDIESLLMGESTEAEAEMQILQSRLVLIKVVEKLRLEISTRPNLFPVIGGAIYRARADYAKPAAAILGLSGYAWGGEKIKVTSLDVPPSLVDQKMYLRAVGNDSFVLFDDDHTKLLNGKIGEAALASTPFGEIKIFVQDLSARPATEFTVIRHSMKEVLGEITDNYVVAEEGKKSGVISLKFQGPSPIYAASVIQEIENAYVRQNIERRSEEAGESLDYLQEQLPLVKGKVDEAQVKLNAYQLKRGSVDVTKETELILQQSVDLETQRLQLAQQRQESLAHFTPEHPVILALDAQISEIERKQADVKKRTQLLPQTQQDVLELNRDVAVNSDLYTSLLNTIQQLQVAKAGTVGDVRIVDFPLPPVKPAKPKKLLIIALSLFVGLFTGILLVYLQKALIKGVDQPDAVEQKLGLPTYATIPFVPAQRRIEKAIKLGVKGSHVLAVLDGGNVAVESLRSLRSSLHFAMLEANNNVVMFTGPSPGLGKSFVSINLGVVLATAGKRTVVVDADLRRGHLHRYLDQRESPGISNYVAGEGDLESIVQPTSVEGLHFVGRGSAPPNPSELLLHERFGELVKSLEKRFDYVLIDTAPVLPVADAMIVGRTAGTVLVVLKAAEHPMHAIEETVRRLNRAGIKPKGVIFNQVGLRAGSYGYGGYGYNYATEYRSSEST